MRKHHPVNRKEAKQIIQEEYKEAILEQDSRLKEAMEAMAEGVGQHMDRIIFDEVLFKLGEQGEEETIKKLMKYHGKYYNALKEAASKIEE